MAIKVVRCAGGGHDLQTQVGETPCCLYTRLLVTVGQGHEHGSPGRQSPPGGNLGLREGQASSQVDAHHLSGRTHLGTQYRVGFREPVKGQYGLLDRDVVTHHWFGEQALKAEVVEGGAQHHPAGYLG